MRKDIDNLFGKIDNKKQLDEQENKLYENIFTKELFSFDNYLYDKVGNHLNKNENTYSTVVAGYVFYSTLIFVGYVIIRILYDFIWDFNHKIRTAIKEGLNISFFMPVNLLYYIYKRF